MYKALGFTNARIQKIYMVKGLLSAVAGVTAGMFFGEILGEGLCGMIIKSFGADGFRFVTDWEKVLFLIPSICLMTAGIAVWTGILEIKKVKAFECCMRKE